MESHASSVNQSGAYQVTQHTSTGDLIHTSGTMGQLFVVLSIITILGVIAGMIGRVCGGRHWGGDSPYDFEGWVEKQCASCIDGDLETGEEAAAPPTEEAPPPEEAAAPPPPPEGEAAADPPEGGGEPPPAGGG